MAWTKVDRQRVTDGKPPLGVPVYLSEEVANDQSKDLVFDTDIAEGDDRGINAFHILGVRIEYDTTDGGAGSRSVAWSVLDSAADVVAGQGVDTDFAAGGLTTRTLVAGQSTSVTPTTAADGGSDPFPSHVFLLPGQTFRVAATANSAATDDMTLHIFGIMR